MRYVSIALILGCLCALCHLSGVAVHVVLLLRSEIPFETADPDLGYLVAGAFYPDAFYNCLGLSEVGEYDHWSPFLYELVQYYHRLPMDLEDRPKIKKFIYGIFGHQIADITWHSLRMRLGLLKMLNNVEFQNDDNFSKSHLFLDTGGDFILLHHLLSNLSPEARDKTIETLETQWMVPTKHLVQLYRNLGYTNINLWKLDHCMRRGYTLLQLELSTTLRNRDTALYYLEESPMMETLLEEYYLGGIQEITHTIDQCVPNLDLWFNDLDRVLDPRQVCEVFRGSSLLKTEPFAIKVVNLKAGTTYISPYVPKSYFGYDIQVGKFLGDDTDCIAVSAPFEDGVGSVYVIPLDEFETAESTSKRGYKITLLNERTMTYPPRFGFRMLTYMEQFLIISSPGLSLLKIYYQDKVILELVGDESTDNLIGEIGLKQLGVLLKLDDNGKDIVVGSKYADYSDEQEQKGLIRILDGEALVNELLRNLENKAPLTLKMETFVKEQLKLPELLNQESHFENFGSVYASTGSFRAIGVDNLGLVVIYKDKKPQWVINSDLEVDSYGARQYEKQSSKQRAEFASDFVEFFHYKGKIYLIITAKSKTLDNIRCVQCGAGYIFQMTEHDTWNLIVEFSLSSPSEVHRFDRFGSHARLLPGDHLLVVASSSSYGGFVYDLKLGEIISEYESKGGDQVLYWKVGESQAVVEEVQQVGYTGFGLSGLLYCKGKIIVGMPFLGYSELDKKEKQLVGNVGIYNHMLE